jgi:iron(III) transport system ATP-binding protein
MRNTGVTSQERPQTGDWGPRGSAAASFPARLTFEHITHNYGGVEAVKDVSLELALGEIICLLGPSGCGKTTLLRIAAGVERPQVGRILLDGEEVAGPSGYVPPEKRNVGLMFQDFALFPHLSILDNVAFGLRKLESGHALREARAALRRVGMSAYETAYPHVLSGGEQQRVALARAIVPRPSVLLMDEPFSGLDQRLRESVRDETLAVLRETGASCLLVTHDPGEAMSMADRIAVMRAGRLVQIASAEQIYRHPVDVHTARFFCDFNELEGTVKGGTVATPFGAVAAPTDLEGRDVLVLVRPQGLVPTTRKSGIEGWVLSTKYLGDASMVSVAFQGVDAPMTVRLSGTSIPEKGDAIRLILDREHVFVFTNNGDDVSDEA